MATYHIRELQLNYEELNRESFPYTRMRYSILADGFEIETGILNVRDMYLRFSDMCHASMLPLQ